MHSNSLDNLKPWQAGQSGNPSGRKVGSKNVATIVRELLEQEVDTALLTNSSLAALTNDKPKSYAEAIALTLFIKALEGNVQAARLVFETISSKYASETTENGFFQADKLLVEIVKSDKSVESLQ
jgi:hypothetical protein